MSEALAQRAICRAVMGDGDGTHYRDMIALVETVRGIEFPTRYYGAQVTLCEDAGYMLRVYRRTVAAYIDEPLVEVRRHGQNSYTDAAQIREPEIRMVEHLLTEELAPRHRSLLKRKLGRLYVVHGSHAKSSRDYHLALRSYISALRLPGVRVRALAHLLTIPIVALLRGMRLARTWLLTRLSRNYTTCVTCGRSIWHCLSGVGGRNFREQPLCCYAVNRTFVASYALADVLLARARRE
jgi:hypothetical protein